jgi:non-canonical purine NTP pyrophosphatase (RdgB/HAM1 family)
VRRVVLATRNAHKVAELKAILDDVISGLDLEIVGVDEFPDVEDVVETGVTFAENATLKAVAVAQATGFPALADDSGLAVEVLGGSPGVFRRGPRRLAGGVQRPLGRHPWSGPGQPRPLAGPALRCP